jgi:hypothetical protein
MSASEVGSGTIEKVDTVTGVASVRLTEPCEQIADLHVGAFFSGRSARLPHEGDKVRVQFQTFPGGLTVLAARLVSGR